MSNADDGAFPAQWISTPGLTKREYAAIEAMKGILSNHSMVDGMSSTAVDWVVESAIQAADDLLARLAEPPQ